MITSSKPSHGLSSTSFVSGCCTYVGVGGWDWVDIMMVVDCLINLDEADKGLLNTKYPWSRPGGWARCWGTCQWWRWWRGRWRRARWSWRARRSEASLAGPTILWGCGKNIWTSSLSHLQNGFLDLAVWYYSWREGQKYCLNETAKQIRSTYMLPNKIGIIDGYTAGNFASSPLIWLKASSCPAKLLLLLPLLIIILIIIITSDRVESIFLSS